MNARIVNGHVVRDGATVVVADTVHAQSAVDAGFRASDVHYQVLCRKHHRRGDLGTADSVGQGLTLDV